MCLISEKRGFSMKKVLTVSCAAILLLIIFTASNNRSVVRAQSPPATVEWSNSELTADQNGAVELGTPGSGSNPTQGAMPYVDFHFGNGFSQDYNARLINNADGSFEILAQRPSN